MSVKKHDVLRELKDIFNQARKDEKFSLNINTDDNVRRTIKPYKVKTKPLIEFGISELQNRNDISFLDFSGAVIDAYHEVGHCRSYNSMMQHESVDAMLVDYVSQYKNPEYRNCTEVQSYAEVDAEIYGLRKAREYFREHLPDEMKAVDGNLLVHGRAWFDGVREQMGFAWASNNFDEFIAGAEKYRDSLTKDQPVFRYEDLYASSDVVAKSLRERNSFLNKVFTETENGWEQRNAAFDITVRDCKELRENIPALHGYETSITKYQHGRRLPDISSVEETTESQRNIDFGEDGKP